MPTTPAATSTPTTTAATQQRPALTRLAAIFLLWEILTNAQDIQDLALSILLCDLLTPLRIVAVNAGLIHPLAVVLLAPFLILAGLLCWHLWQQARPT